MRTASSALVTEFGEFRLHGFGDPRTGQEHAALVLGDLKGTQPVLARIHSAYELQRAGADTVDANRLLGLPDDARDYTIAAQMLFALGVDKVRLMTNNPAKISALEASGVTVAERVPLFAGRNAHNGSYIQTKRRRMGHLSSEHMPSP